MNCQMLQQVVTAFKQLKRHVLLHFPYLAHMTAGILSAQFLCQCYLASVQQ